MFSTLFEKYFEITDKIIDKQSLLTFKDIWKQIITDEIYYKLSYRCKREYNKKTFYNWLREHTKYNTLYNNSAIIALNVIRKNNIHI
jgi:hypothetical protein